MSYSLSDHVNAVETLMVGARQTVNSKLTEMSAEDRILRASLILEEAMEAIHALGVDFVLGKFLDAGQENVNPVEYLDACCDMTVIATGGLVSMGLSSVFEQALERVDANNLTKLEGERRYNELGKLLKPPHYKPVVLDDLVEKCK